MLIALLWMMFLFSLSRIAFYLYNIAFFPGMTLQRFMLILWGGVHFDLSAILYTNVLFIILILLPFKFRFAKIYKNILKWTFILPNSIVLLANTADIIYYRFTLRRTTASIFSQFKHEKNMGILSLHFIIDYWYVTIFFMLLIFLLIKGYNKLVKIEGPQVKNIYAFYLSGLVMICIVGTLFVGGVRGDFKNSTRPITLSNAGEYAAIPKDVHIILNTPFAIYRTFTKPVITKVHYYASEQELEKVYSPLRQPTAGEFKRQNVVILILESMSREYFGIFNKDIDGGKYSGYTPFLDSLAAESKTFFYAFANGRKSIDGLPSVIASIPSIEVPFVLSHYSSDKVNGLGNILKTKGYHTSFFHGAPNGSMGFKAFVNLAGYDFYYGKTEYEQEHGMNDFDGAWGIWDENFFQFFADKLNTFPQPFHSTLFSVSSHSPFKLPEKYHDVFKGGSMPIYKLIQFTDYSLKEFFRKASTMPWFKNTLFVITADHCSALVNYDEYRTAAGFFLIPVIFYSPSDTQKGMKYDIAQQIDIMPTILGTLNYDKSYIAFGCDLFNPSEEKFAFNYLDNLYQIFIGDYLLLFDGTRSVALYQFKTDKLLKKNLVNTMPEVREKMEKKIKAIIQQYNNRMVDDNLTPEGSQLKSQISNSK